jgi:hypothetical protein
MSTTSPTAASDDRPGADVPAATERLTAAIEALTAQPGNPRLGGGKAPEQELSPLQLAGRLTGLALNTARASGDERFPGAFGHTALASGIEGSLPDPAARLAVITFLSGALYDLTVGLGLKDLTGAATVLMSTAELNLLEGSDEPGEQVREWAQELRGRVHRCAVALALGAEQANPQPESGS